MKIETAHKALEEGRSQEAIARAMIVSAEMAITQTAILREIAQSLNYVAQNTCRLDESLEALVRLLEHDSDRSVRMVLER